MTLRRLIVTHRAPDLDAITSCWLLKNFDSQTHGSAQFAFVNAGDKLNESQAEQLGFSISEVTHVDTGLGRFDHHDEEKGQQYTCAAQQVYTYLCQIHPELQDDRATQIIIDFALQIDHFRDVYWPEADNYRYLFMVHDIIQGMDFSINPDDENQIIFGMRMLDYIYGSVQHQLKAEEIIQSKGQEFTIPGGKGIGLETRNDETVRLAQKQGYLLAVRKDPENGQIRIKCRPDSPFELRAVYEKIIQVDRIGTWFYHPSGRMVLNGSTKNPNQLPSPLTLAEVIRIVQQELGKE